MTRKEFQQGESLMAQLSEILRFPVMKQALDILFEEGPSDMPLPIPGVDYGAQVAAVGAASIGWNKALKALKNLSIKPTAFAQKAASQNEMYKDEAKRRVAASKLYTEAEIEEISK